MSKLRDSAKGQPCMVRLWCCNHNPETTVLAHYRMKGDGAGRKPSDQRAAFACSACHDEIDGRTHKTNMTRREILLDFAEGVFRTQDYWRDNGYL